MNELICKAIEDRVELCFNYKGKARLVEPHTYGITLKGENGLCAWQLSGGSGFDFRLFLEREMSHLKMRDPFAHARPGYRMGDQQFETIFAEL